MLIERYSKKVKISNDKSCFFYYLKNRKEITFINVHIDYR